jgi:hypothetical protein
MSVSKLEKDLQIPIKPTGRLNYKPIIIADSKGRYIHSHSDLLSQFGYSAKFIYRGGARLADYFPWLVKSLQGEVNQYGNIVIYLWLGTCDLTRRNGRYITLRHSAEKQAVEYIQYQLYRYNHFIAAFPNVKIVFLEIPSFSIREWNKSKGHTDSFFLIEED